MHIKEKSEKNENISSISTCEKNRGSSNNKPRKNEVAWNGVVIRQESGTMETFELLRSDDDTNKKPRAKKNIDLVTGMVINTRDNQEYKHDDEINDGDVGNHH